VLPEVKELTSTPNEVEYDRNIAPATVLPGTAMAAYAGEEKQNLAKQGYLRVGYGNIGNADIDGNYLFNLSAKDKLNLSLGLQGMDGKVYGMNLYDRDLDVYFKDKWDSRYYRTRAGIDYTHQFDRMDFNIAGNFGLSNFNYMPVALPTHQRFTSGDVRFGVNSTDQSLPVRFHLQTGLYMYSRAHNYLTPDRQGQPKDRSINETSIRTKGDFTGDITEGQQIGVAFEMNNLFYNNDFFENYTTLLLKPYYALGEEDVWKLNLGVNVDMAFGYGKKIRVSPDVNAEYIFSDRYVLYGSATGGRLLNDFRRLEQYNPYGELFSQIEDSYEQLNASLGFKMSPFTGMWLNLYGGYQIIKDDLFDYDNSYFYNASSSRSFFLYTGYGQEETKNAYVSLQVNYAFKNIFSLMAKGQHYDWKADNELALRFKPQYRYDLQVNIRPVSVLNINAAYVYAKREKTNIINVPDVDNLSNLSLGATYDLFEGMSIYARVSNLLNNKAPYYSNSPVPGINFLGGVIFSF